MHTLGLHGYAGRATPQEAATAVHTAVQVAHCEAGEAETDGERDGLGDADAAGDGEAGVRVGVADGDGVAETLAQGTAQSAARQLQVRGQSLAPQ